MADLPLGQIVRSNRHRAADWQGSAGALALDGGESLSEAKKKRHHVVSKEEDEGFDCRFAL